MGFGANPTGKRMAVVIGSAHDRHHKSPCGRDANALAAAPKLNGVGCAAVTQRGTLKVIHINIRW